MRVSKQATPIFHLPYLTRATNLSRLSMKFARFILWDMSDAVKSKISNASTNHHLLNAPIVVIEADGMGGDGRLRCPGPLQPGH